jgi:hypothetical protein
MTRAQRAPADRAFHLDIQPPRRRHSEAAKYIAVVFWVAGYSASTIASFLGLRRAQALALAQKSGVIDCAIATDDERRRLLKDLEGIRFEDGKPIDDGALNRFDWKIVDMTDGRKRRPTKRAT